MTASQLKASILDLAIRGKLVAQDPADEPATKLLERIREGRALSRPSRRTAPAAAPITDDEKPFDLPVGWEWVRIGDLVSPLGGIWTGTKKPFENVAVIRATNFTKDCELSFDRIVRIDVEASKLENRTLRENDFIIEKSGGGENMPVGRVVRFNGWHEKCTFCNFTTLLRLVVADAQDPAFLHLCFKHVYVSGRTIPLQSNTTNLRNLDLTRYLNLPVPLPPLAEQTRIVAKVEELLPMVEEYGAAFERRRKMVGELPEKLRKSILQRAIEGKLVAQDPDDEPASELLAKIAAEKARLQKNGKAKKEKPLPPIADDEKPFDLPDGWAWVRLGAVADVLAGHPFDGKGYSQEGVKICGGLIIMPNEIKWQECKRWPSAKGLEDFLLAEGDIVIALDRPWISDGAKVGSIKSQDLPCLLIQRTARIRSSRVLPEYLMMLLKLPMLKQHCNITEMTVPHISHKDIQTYPIPLPPLAEQKRIVAKVESLLADVERLKKSVL